MEAQKDNLSYHFTRLDEVIKGFNTKVLLFDEIQIIKEWERYVRQKLDEGYKLVITGFLPRIYPLTFTFVV